MKKLCLGAATALLLSCGAAPAMTLYTNGVEEIDPGKIRIALAEPDKYPNPKLRVLAPKGPAGMTYGGQVDTIVWGALGRADRPFLLATYNTGRFAYSPASEILDQFFPKDAIELKTVSDGEVPSPFGTVDYIIVRVNDRKSAAGRTCAFWNGFLDGNTMIYQGLFCPANHEATIDDVNAGVKSVVLKKP